MYVFDRRENAYYFSHFLSTESLHFWFHRVDSLGIGPRLQYVKPRSCTFYDHVLAIPGGRPFVEVDAESLSLFLST